MHSAMCKMKVSASPIYWNYFRRKYQNFQLCIMHLIHGAFQEGISLGNPLTETVIAVGVVRGATGQGAAGQPGQLALAPCGGHTVIAGGTAHGVVRDAAAIILPPSLSAVKKKPPRP